MVRSVSVFHLSVARAPICAGAKEHVIEDAQAKTLRDRPRAASPRNNCPRKRAASSSRPCHVLRSAPMTSGPSGSSAAVDRTCTSRIHGVQNTPQPLPSAERVEMNDRDRDRPDLRDDDDAPLPLAGQFDGNRFGEREASRGWRCRDLPPGPPLMCRCASTARKSARAQLARSSARCRSARQVRCARMRVGARRGAGERGHAVGAHGLLQQQHVMTNARARRCASPLRQIA